MKEDVKLIDEHGFRLDGRRWDELRPIVAKAGVLKNATGSGYFAFGNTVAIAGVFGPKEVIPKHLEDPEKAILRCRYTMAPFSTKERTSPAPSRRSMEISLVVRRALESVVFLEDFPRTMIEVYIEVLEANASTRCAAVNAAAIALADAGVPMRDLVSSVSIGVIDGQLVLDVAGKEDEAGDVDLPFAYFPRKNEIVLLQMDGIIEPEKLKEAIRVATQACKRVYEAQRLALKRKYEEMEFDLGVKNE